MVPVLLFGCSSDGGFVPFPGLEDIASNNDVMVFSRSVFVQVLASRPCNSHCGSWPDRVHSGLLT